jgi:hypothetical protein
MWYLTPGRAMRTTTTAARKEPKHADTKDCCHVCKKLARKAQMHFGVLVEAYQTHGDQCRPRVPANERELIRKPVKWQIVPSLISDGPRGLQSTNLPGPSSVLNWCGFQVFVRPSCVANGSVTFIAFGRLYELNEGSLGAKWCSQVCLAWHQGPAHRTGCVSNAPVKML